MRLLKKLTRFTVFLCSIAALFLSGLILITPEPESLDSVQSATIVNDVTAMNPVVVKRVVTPTSVSQIQDLLRADAGPVSVGGGHFSMGGQTASEDTLHLDMRQMNRVLKLDKEHQTVTVEAGITWHQLIEALEPEGLSVKIMQSYSNFTVGGSLSVNVHGRYIGFGPIVSSVDSIKIVLADGSVVEASRTSNREIFAGAIGGYGVVGIIVEATLSVAQNVPLQRELSVLSRNDYADYFRTNIRDNRDIIFQNGDLIPDRYDQVYSVVWRKTDRELTEKQGIAISRPRPWIDKALSFIVLDLPYGIRLRRYLEPLRYRGDPVVWRNFEASYDVSDLAPISNPDWSYVLQEYFIPVEKFQQFSVAIADILNHHQVQVANLSIRHALPDTESLLSWAPREVFAFVLYYKQSTDVAARREVGNWTRELIDASLRLGGSYYLPYQPHASREQFLKAYPSAPDFFALKHRLDPSYRFRNKLWDAYYRPDISRQIMEATLSIPGYFRPEDQTYLTVPEWQLVFASADLAAATALHSQSDFPFFSAILEFWRTYARVLKSTVGHYPLNPGYHFMNCVIGIHTSVEYLIKGIYEGTIGHLTTKLAGGSERAASSSADIYIHRVYREYSAFIHTSPWYEFSFMQSLKGLWELPLGSEDSVVRFYERKVIFSIELLAKAAMSRLFSSGTDSLYGEEGLTIGAVVNASPVARARYFTQEQIQGSINDQITLLKLPRYQLFTDLVKKLISEPQGEGVSFLEIAGNKRVVFSCIAPKGWYPSVSGAALVGELSLFSQPELKRVVFSVTTQDLLDVARRLLKTGVQLDHVFDY